MKVPSQIRSVVRFGAFEVNLSSGELQKHGIKIRLQEQPFQILLMLLDRPGEVVAREDLRRKLWPSDTFVDFDVGLNSAILRLRNALGDSAEKPRFVETLPRRGYRFIARVDDSAPPSAHTSPSGDAASVAADPATIPTAKPATELSRAARKGHQLQYWRLIVFALAACLAIVVALNPGGLRQRVLGKSRPPKIESIAVLPLENLTGDPSQEYFADGMTDGLTTELAQVSALRVISRTSAVRYKGEKKLLAQIARELKVGAVVEGSVKRAGEQIWITIQLIDTTTDRHLWARSYKRDLRDIATLQSEVARAIASEIQIRMTPQERARLASARPVKPEAYEAYLKGSYFANKRTEQGMVKSIHYFEKAAQEDPGYALAFSGLADSYALLGFFGVFPSKEAYPRAKSAAAKALEMDDTLAQAHESMAGAKLWFDWDWSGAEREYKRALELNPGYAVAHRNYGSYLSAMGRLDESIVEAKRALELDPLSLTMNTHLGYMFYLARQYDRAIEQYRKTLELDPNHARALRDLSLAYAQKGMYKEAVLEGQRAIDRSEASPLMLAILGYAYAASHDTVKAREVLTRLKKLSKQRYVSPFYVAMIHAGLGQKDETFVWLEKCYEQRSSQLVLLNIHPAFDSLRSDARFTELVRRIGLPENGSRK